MQAVDFLIIGGGPAGSAAAITAAAAGKRVCQVVRPRRPEEQFGESLSPAAPGLLHQLGVHHLFSTAGHLPCYTNRSVWGSAQVHVQDFLRDPRGHGYHLDRTLFEHHLQQRALSLGVTILQDRPLRDGIYEAGTWSFSADLPNASYVIDATGKHAAFARRQGASRIIHRKQVALIYHMTLAETPKDTSSLVESTEKGWWYTAPIPNARMVACFFTDADLHDSQHVRTPQGSEALLRQASHTRQRLLTAGARPQGPPRFVDASSGYLDRVCGPGYLAVGDAAMSYDPLSAHGITLALRTGIHGVGALIAGTVDTYLAKLTQAFATYAQECSRHYAAEQRFAQAPYWSRRCIGSGRSEQQLQE